MSDVEISERLKCNWIFLYGNWRVYCSKSVNKIKMSNFELLQRNI